MLRKRCSDDAFLEAVYSSSTYAEISEKTGQKISTTMARYIRTKKILEKQNIILPKMLRKQHTRNSNISNLAAKAKTLQKLYSDI